MDLENKVILITGASKGIGEAIAYAMAREKAKVIITYNSDGESAKRVEQKCKELGSPDAFIVSLNVKDNEKIRETAKQVEEKFGHVDFLINNAGVISWEKFEHETFEEIENQLRTNLEGVIKTTSAFLPIIKEGIINIASRAGHHPFVGRSVYTASKFGVIGFTQSLSLDYPDLKIFSVSPGAVKTQMWSYGNGVEPSIVADYIIKALKGEIPLKDGDLNLYEILR